MPEKRSIERARADRRSGKSPSTPAGEFVREEIDKIRAAAIGMIAFGIEFQIVEHAMIIAPGDDFTFGAA